jgi:hypothetical protein
VGWDTLASPCSSHACFIAHVLPRPTCHNMTDLSIHGWNSSISRPTMLGYSMLAVTCLATACCAYCCVCGLHCTGLHAFKIAHVGESRACGESRARRRKSRTSEKVAHVGESRARRRTPCTSEKVAHVGESRARRRKSRTSEKVSHAIKVAHVGEHGLMRPPSQQLGWRSWVFHWFGRAGFWPRRTSEVICILYLGAKRLA